MFANFTDTVTYHLDYYWRFLVREWDHMTPIHAASLLGAIALFGWFMMRSSR